jgi:L-ribulose-5-phosphate 4-epimerase
MKWEDMVVLETSGKVVEGTLHPSSDTPTHLELYRNFPDACGVVHTHSEWATSWAQAGRPIPPYGTTHADYFHGEIPCTRSLTSDEVENEYELNTGRVIVEAFRNIDPAAIPAVLVAGHAPFSWGRDVEEAVQHAVVLEYVAKMAFRNLLLGNDQAIEPYLLDKHFTRKHGKSAYYGQG